MPVTLTLDSPETTPANTVLAIIELSLDYKNGVARGKVEFDSGTVRWYQEPRPGNPADSHEDVKAAIRAINKADNRVKSMEQKIIERWVGKGILPPGTVGGSPD